MKKQTTIETLSLIEVISSILKNKILNKGYSEDVLRKIIFQDIKTIDYSNRDSVNEDIIKKISALLKEENINSTNLKTTFSQEKIDNHVTELKETGISLLGEVLSPKQVTEIHQNLKNKPVFNGHVWSASDKKDYNLDQAKESFPQASYMLQDSLAAPYLLETMSNPNFLKIAEKYLEVTPKLYSANLMWSFGKNPDPKAGVARMFHRDIDNFSFCVLFIFLTDVKKGSGSHQYIKQSHKKEAIQKLFISLKEHLNESDYNAAINYLNSDKLGAGYTESEVLPLQRIEELFKDEMLEVTGPAGHAFIADPYGLHRGVPVISDDRLLFWGRFTPFDNGFASSSSTHRVNWNNVKNRIEQNSYNEYVLSPLLSNEDNSELHNPDVKRVDEKVLVGSSAEISADLLKSMGTTKYVKNCAKTVINRKKSRISKK